MTDYDIQADEIIKRFNITEPIKLPRPIYVLPDQYTWLKADVRTCLNSAWRTKIRQARTLIYSSAETPTIDDMARIMDAGNQVSSLSEAHFISTPMICCDFMDVHSGHPDLNLDWSDAVRPLFGLPWKTDRNLPEDVILLMKDDKPLVALVGVALRRLI